MDEFYLIGANLEHSFSPLVHSYFGDYSYKTKNLKEEELKDFILSKNYKGLNITLPYKNTVIQYLDEYDEIVQKTQSCNVIVIVNGIIKGYNTDYYGFSFMLDYFAFNLVNSKIMILGTGSTSRTIQTLLQDQNEIILMSRTNKDNSHQYSEIKDFLDVDYIINTTPVGMYPNNYQKLINIQDFNNLKGVIDVIFNPLNTQLLVESKKKKIKCCNGLLMLIEQARRSNELFFGKPNKIDVIDVFKALSFQKKNIALVGMPMSGKSKTGLKLANLIGREFVDLDNYIEIKEKRTIRDIFANNGEAYFRAVESKHLKTLMKMHGLVISLGGGIVEKNENYYIIHENAFVVNLYRNVEKLIYNKNRPLINDVDDYMRLFAQRKDKYLEYADISFLNNGSVTTLAKKIWEAFSEDINT